MAKSAAIKEQTKEDVKELREAVTDLKEDMSALMRIGAQKGSSTLRHLVHDAGTKARHYYDMTCDKAEQAYDYANDQVKTHPKRTALIALAAGVIIGALLNRKS